MNKLFAFSLGQTALLLCLLLVAPLSNGQTIAFIMGSQNGAKLQSLDVRALQHIFLRKRTLNAQGNTWIPINLTAETPLRSAVTQKILHKSASELERYWYEMYFDGVSPPYVLASEEAAIRFVIDTPGALGYVLACHVDKRVQVVFELEVENNSALSCATH